MVQTLGIGLFAMALASVLVSPRAGSIAAFFHGADAAGRAPSLWTLVLSQVTTWIFARSLMNAAILGYFYGIAGIVAYAAYYLSFVTGAWIVDSLRFRHDAASIQEFLNDRFGRTGTACFNIVVGVRLVSEVFANLLVVGLLFGAAGSTGYIVAVLATAAVILGYAALGGLRASLRTDVLQCAAMFVLLAILLVQTMGHADFSAGDILASSPDPASPGWVLLAVALLQVVSYPLHDPVMMDRGFLADRDTTHCSFLHAAWISILCILAFGCIGIYAGLHKMPGEAMMAALERLYPYVSMVVFNLVLIVSAMSTLDSTLCSAAKLTVVDMRAAKPTLRNGRLAMAGFMGGGLFLLFLGSNDLFEAVAVSGTASMFLAPVAVVSIWMGRRDVPTWSYMVAFCAAMIGATVYFLESSGYAAIVAPLTGYTHKYTHLLIICAAVLLAGFAAFAVGIVTQRRSTASS
ncbi:MAG: sodium:proline symporter [Alphaproteobacteria bacterium]